jgi:enoyl-CoA hydratase/carnithine racemase
MSASAFTTLECKTLQLQTSGAVLTITLARPQAYNAVSMEMLEEFHTVLDFLRHPNSMHVPFDPHHPRVVVLAASGRAFSGGVDIKAADRGVGGKAWNYKDMRSQQLLARAIEKMRSVPQPFIAAVQGPAAGAGFALALACDVRIAQRSASFSAAFVRLALTGTDMGTSFFLPRLAGLGIASEMLLTGRPLCAERAYQVGLVNELVENDDQLKASAAKMAGEMMALSPLGLQLTKEQLSATAEGGSLRAALTAENSHQMLLVNDTRAAQVAQAWVNKLMGSSGSRPRAKL